MTPLWTSAEIEAATGGVASAPFEVGGVTFDSREAGPGDLFVAMPGTASDGHAFVDQAFSQGAGAALVSKAVAVNVLDAFNAGIKAIRFYAYRGMKLLGETKSPLGNN